MSTNKVFQTDLKFNENLVTLLSVMNIYDYVTEFSLFSVHLNIYFANILHISCSVFDIN